MGRRYGSLVGGLPLFYFCGAGPGRLKPYRQGPVVNPEAGSFRLWSRGQLCWNADATEEALAALLSFKGKSPLKCEAIA